MDLRFSVTWDYRCPFAANAHDHVVEGLLDGAPWDVRFVPFSLGQVHVGEHESPIWERPDDDSGLLALQAGVVVRDDHPDHFLAVHRGLFEARHRHGRKLQDPAVVADVLESAGLDAGAILGRVAGGAPLATVRAEHEKAAADAGVWGVPTFVVGDRAAFVRLMRGADGDPATARRTVERLVEAVGDWHDLNELKHTRIPR